jgi:hypothetical protein
MQLSQPARLVTGLSLITVPTIVYGGLTVLAVVTRNAHGLPPAAELTLTETQQALFRAGHAHAGVLVILSLLLQVLLDAATLSEPARWTARIAAPLAAMLVSGGFFGIAFVPGLSPLLWAGSLCLSVAVLITGVGLVRAPAAPRP